MNGTRGQTDYLNPATQEHKPLVREVLFTAKRALDEWAALLDRSLYWKTLRVIAWALRFNDNALAKKREAKERITYHRRDLKGRTPLSPESSSGR